MSTTSLCSVFNSLLPRASSSCTAIVFASASVYESTEAGSIFIFWGGGRAWKWRASETCGRCDAKKIINFGRSSAALDGDWRQINMYVCQIVISSASQCAHGPKSRSGTMRPCWYTSSSWGIVCGEYSLAPCYLISGLETCGVASWTFLCARSCYSWCVSSFSTWCT